MVNNILEATKIINSSKYIVAVTGAGISVDSGFQHFKELMVFGLDLENLV